LLLATDRPLPISVLRCSVVGDAHNIALWCSLLPFLYSLHAERVHSHLIQSFLLSLHPPNYSRRHKPLEFLVEKFGATDTLMAYLYQLLRMSILFVLHGLSWTIDYYVLSLFYGSISETIFSIVMTPHVSVCITQINIENLFHRNKTSFALSPRGRVPQLAPWQLGHPHLLSTP
jgi:hypothetical protein